MAESTILLNPSLFDLAVDPTDRTALSATGEPTQTIALRKHYPIGIIGFKVPQGSAFIVSPNPWILMKLYTDAGGTTEISGSDTILFYSKTPSDPPQSLGTQITTPLQYRPWRDNDLSKQGMASFSSRLTLPIQEEFSLRENFMLVVAVSTMLPTENINWTESYIQIPVTQKTVY